MFQIIRKLLHLHFLCLDLKEIKLTRNLETDLFKKKKIITNLQKKIIFKEGKILQSLYRTAVDLNIQTKHNY